MNTKESFTDCKILIKLVERIMLNIFRHYYRFSGIRKLMILKKSSLKFINRDKKKSTKFEEIKGKTGIDRRIHSENSF